MTTPQLTEMKALHRNLLYTFTYSVTRESFYKGIKLGMVHNFQLALLGTHCENRLENKRHSAVNILKLFSASGSKGTALRRMSPSEHPGTIRLTELFLK